MITFRDGLEQYLIETIPAGGPTQVEYDKRRAALAPHEVASTLTPRVGYGVLPRETIHAIVDLAAGETIIEIGAGSGYVAACLCAAGAAVHAYNVDEGEWCWPDKFHPIKQGRVTAIPYTTSVYVMLWALGPPAIREDMALECLRRMPVGATLVLYGSIYGSGGHLRGLCETLDSLPMIKLHPLAAGHRAELLRKVRPTLAPVREGKRSRRRR